MKSILFLLIFTSVIIAQDESISKLFPGKWKMQTSKTVSYEEWVVTNETELIGKSHMISNGSEEITEIIYLKKFGEQWAYVAVPEGQSITLFALVEYTQQKFIFENKEHDFPQRVIYEFLEDGKLTAAIEGNISGEMKRKEFNFQKVED